MTEALLGRGVWVILAAGDISCTQRAVLHSRFLSAVRMPQEDICTTYDAAAQALGGPKAAERRCVERAVCCNGSAHLGVARRGPTER